ncbi:outer membrane protein [Devosia sp. A16]|uniref:outer membrane protein n=1 Tax=Devosia sp. A16 TaxID=1736675 RepID=UPI000A404420|nr:outer membrane beta-barrel protein [Devosia sp. A16]
MQLGRLGSWPARLRRRRIHALSDRRSGVRPGPCLASHVTNLHVGWTIGAGVEFAVSDALSLDLLYRYTDLAPEDYAAPNVGLETHSVTAGLNSSS